MVDFRNVCRKVLYIYIAEVCDGHQFDCDARNPCNGTEPCGEQMRHAAQNRENYVQCSQGGNGCKVETCGRQQVYDASEQVCKDIG